MKPIVIDVETTTFQSGHPFSESNKLCYAGSFDGTNSHLVSCEYTGAPYGPGLTGFFSGIGNHDLLVGFNIKFDLHWLRRYGFDHRPFNVWDLQLVEFIITGQSRPFPSLDDTCNRCGLVGKSGDIAARYWDQGIDTPQIPEQELRDYLENDCRIEWDLFQWQMKYLNDNPSLKRICWDACQDIKVTAEMEWNGLLLDRSLCESLSNQFQEKIQGIDTQLALLAPEMVGRWNSNDWLSAFLYGGTVPRDELVPTTFTYKDGRQKEKLRKERVPTVFPRQVEPLKKSNVKKEGFFKVDEGTLKKLKAKGNVKKIIDLMLTRNKLEKKVSTYFEGWPKLYEEMQWQNDIIHGQLNHTRAVTGRLSSSKPNQQNMDPELLKCLKTRFPMMV